MSAFQIAQLNLGWYCDRLATTQRFSAERTVAINIAEDATLAPIMAGFITEAMGLDFPIRGLVLRSNRYLAMAAARHHFAVYRRAKQPR